MKYISFAIPCYNSESYMEHAIESILKGGEDVEIIIVMMDRWMGHQRLQNSMKESIRRL